MFLQTNLLPCLENSWNSQKTLRWDLNQQPLQSAAAANVWKVKRIVRKEMLGRMKKLKKYPCKESCLINKQVI